MLLREIVEINPVIQTVTIAFESFFSSPSAATGFSGHRILGLVAIGLEVLFHLNNQRPLAEKYELHL